MKNGLTIFILFLILLFSTYNAESQLTIELPEKAEQNKELLESGEMLSVLVLENGLKVYLDHDKNKSKVWGAVIVKGGVKSEDPEVTGLAHYFEHMMFKGTSRIGTNDYNSERVYLDSIQQMFDLLQYSKDDENFRQGIIKKIDYYSQKAAKYANPTEFSKLVSQIGGSELNAYTTYENIVYSNSFPNSSLEQWLHLYSHRFKDPVFRLFASELESVYEEKNMSLDNIYMNIYEDVYKNFYPNSVYGQKTVLGSIDDLKNPSITKIKEYYKQNYIAPNMALILSGNLEIPDLEKVLNETFGTLPRGVKKDSPVALEPQLKGRKKVVSRLAPIPFGIIGYRTVPENHEDMIVLDFIQRLMSNEMEIGLLDNLAKNNKLMMVKAYNDKHSDIGGSFFAYIPKPFIQSLKNGEKLVLNEIEKLKKGEIDKDLMKAVKQSYLLEFQKKLENSEQRIDLIIEAFMNDMDFNAIYNRGELIHSIEIAEISRVANKYFGENYLAYYSKTGFPKHDKIDYNNLTPLKFENADGISEFSTFLTSLDEKDESVNVNDVSQDVKITQINPNYELYTVKNPYNDIFTFRVKIGIGTYEKPVLEQLAAYLNNAGSKSKPYQEFTEDLQKIGSSVNFYSSPSYFYIEMQGFDHSFQKSLVLLNDLLRNTEINDDILKKIVNERKIINKLAKNDVNFKSEILQSYALYGKKSEYLTQLSLKEIKKLKAKDLVAVLEEIRSYQTAVHYVGRIDNKTIKENLQTYFYIPLKLIRSKSPVIKKTRKLKSNLVFFLKDKNALQSQINYSIPSTPLRGDVRAYIEPFNRYFGLGSSSILFKELREKRSLAYSVYGYQWAPYRHSDSTIFFGFLSTQANRTVDAISNYNSLLNSLPIDVENAAAVRSWILKDLSMEVTDFRNYSRYAEYWKLQGHGYDPRRDYVKEYDKLDSEVFQSIHSQVVKAKFRIIDIVGDPKKFDLKDLEQFGELKTVKIKDIYNF
jgi:predicted Zn-dependent peptidase